MVDSAWSNERWLRPLLAEVLGQEPVASLAADGRPLWESVVASGLLSDDALLRLAADRFRLPVADLRDGTADARSLLPERWARRLLRGPRPDHPNRPATAAKFAAEAARPTRRRGLTAPGGLR